jgi:DNA processing protein
MSTADDDARAATAALSIAGEPDDPAFRAAYDAVGALDLLESLRVGTPPERLRVFARRARDVDGDRVLADAARRGVRLVLPGDDEWPTRLADLDTHRMAAPRWLWARGPAHLARTTQRSVAIVGSRAATAYGEHVATDLAHELGLQGGRPCPARPTASTARRIAAGSRPAPRPSRCSPVVSTAPIPAATAICCSASRTPA